VLRRATRSKPEDGNKGWVMGVVMPVRACASANRITLLRDVDGDGKAETKPFRKPGLPFGMALVGNDFTWSMRTLWSSSRTRVKPASPFNPSRRWWTRPAAPSTTIDENIPSADGSKLYVTVGSNSNV
jgi:glucose/arabinose dehydrogenase